MPNLMRPPFHPPQSATTPYAGPYPFPTWWTLVWLPHHAPKRITIGAREDQWVSLLDVFFAEFVASMQNLFWDCMNICFQSSMLRTCYICASSRYTVRFICNIVVLLQRVWFALYVSDKRFYIVSILLHFACFVIFCGCRVWIQFKQIIFPNY